jgi:thiol-disulfide isomerase/thioredoxin
MKNLITLILALILLAGCAKQGEKSEKSSSEDSRFQVQTRGEIQYEVKSLDESGLKQLIARRNGKFLSLNLWATWCVPCREEFPNLVKLAGEYNNSDVEFVGLSVDYPDEIESKIIPFLKNNPVNFEIYVQDFEDEGNIIQFLNKSWNGAIPATFIFDTNGIQKAFLPGLRSYDDFKQELERVRNL